MKYVKALIISFFFVAAMIAIQSNDQVINPTHIKADGPGTGNDGEDTSDRPWYCRVFQVGCGDSKENFR
ncbi:hypothetical protein GCM10009123_08040 [Kangiella japonica]|uniref:Uncharacterized protein n=1 Tax=Kangiella japonica TaxID=647384 RepID=A0ABP3CFU7_9GAMM